MLKAGLLEDTVHKATDLAMSALSLPGEKAKLNCKIPRLQEALYKASLLDQWGSGVAEGIVDENTISGGAPTCSL